MGSIEFVWQPPQGATDGGASSTQPPHQVIRLSIPCNNNIGTTTSLNDLKPNWIDYVYSQGFTGGVGFTYHIPKPSTSRNLLPGVKFTVTGRQAPTRAVAAAAAAAAAAAPPPPPRVVPSPAPPPPPPPPPDKTGNRIRFIWRDIMNNKGDRVNVKLDVGFDGPTTNFERYKQDWLDHVKAEGYDNSVDFHYMGPPTCIPGSRIYVKGTPTRPLPPRGENLRMDEASAEGATNYYQDH